jgi:type IV pilus assembly protein PilF
MRLHDARVLIGTTVVLFALAGCHTMSGGRSRDVRQETNLRPEDHSPHRSSQTDIALAEQYIEAGQYEIALDRLQSAVKLEPSSADAYTMLGVLYERINRPALAETSYAKSVKLAPDKGDILNNYGGWLCRSGHPIESDVWFRKALADPFYKTPAIAMGNAASCALKAGKPELAESYDRQVLALDATNAGALQEMATMLHQRGDDMHARAFIERLLAAGQATPEMLDLAASIEDKLGDAAAARSYRTRIATEFPQYTPAKR